VISEQGYTDLEGARTVCAGFEESSYVRGKVFEITADIAVNSDRKIHAVGEGKERRISEAGKIGCKNICLESV
jgi:hypothetical protein